MMPCDDLYNAIRSVKLIKLRADKQEIINSGMKSQVHVQIDG